jgi:hypothetical protein
MKIDWLVLAAALFVIVTSYFLLLRSILVKNREVKRLASLLRQTDGELLRVRSEYAKEITELRADHGKRMTALQSNVRDLTSLLKGHGTSGPEGWLERK